MKKASPILFLAALLFAPLAFGTVEVWSIALLEVLCFTLLLSFVIGREEKGASLRSVPGILPLTLLLVFHAFQLVPLPPSWSPISHVRRETLDELFRLAAFGVFYVMAIQLLADRKNLKGVVRFTVIFGGLLACASIVQHLLPGSFLFFSRDLPKSSPFGPYINRNHYAGLVGMILPIVFGLYLYYRPFSAGGSLRERLRALLAGQEASAHLLAGLAALVIGSSLVVSLSRGAMVGLAAAMFTFGLLWSLKIGWGRWRLSALVLGVLSVLYIGWFGWGAVFERFGQLAESERFMENHRLLIWSDTLEMIGAHPIAGAGFGSFEDLYPGYRTIPGEKTLQHAHNDYLEFLAGGGLVGGGLALWFFAEVFSRSFIAFRKRKDHFAICIFCGSGAGVTAMLVHSLFDFNLQTGANALWFFFLLGLMVSAAHTRTRARNHESYLPGVSFKKASRIGTAVAALLLFASVQFNSGVLLGAKENPKAGRYITAFSTKEEALTVQEKAAKAARLDPLEGDHRYTIANAERAIGDLESSVEHLERAYRLAPTRSLYHQRLGIAYSELGNDEKAEHFFRMGVKYDRIAPLPRRLYGSWLLSQGRAEEGLEYLLSALVLEPKSTEDYIATLVLSGLSDEKIFAFLSASPEQLLHFVGYAEGIGGDDLAMKALRAASALLSEEDFHPPDLYLKVSRAFQARDLTDEALGVLRRGIEAAPEHGAMKVAAARLYEHRGNTTRAAEEYQAALLVNPEDRAARQGLERVQDGPK